MAPRVSPNECRASNFVRKMIENIPRAPLTKLRRDVRLKTYSHLYILTILIYVLIMHVIVHRSLYYYSLTLLYRYTDAGYIVYGLYIAGRYTHIGLHAYTSI